VPDRYAQAASIPGIELARVWGDEPPPWIDTGWERLPDSYFRENFPGSYGIEHNYLAISGGGADGAFGAGLLNGWTAAGTRPEFTIVTGISTGALIAPFAYLGPKYDDELKEIYTKFGTADLVDRRTLVTIPFSESVVDTKRLRAKIASYITPQMMEEIAKQSRRGRRLFIGTVNLDQARPVIWNITAIADSGQPGSLDLIHDIMLASASIPGIFPPVYVEVEAADGKRYEEMHVDGGTASQVFLHPQGLDWNKILRRLKVPGAPNVYIIRNSKVTPAPENVQPWLPAIAGRSVSSLIRTQGIGDMYRMYIEAQRDGLGYNLAFVPDDFDVAPDEIFDTAYMNALYGLAYHKAKRGYPWKKSPPGVSVSR
jgi:hypothetical protein